jgi:hypothetical protein
MAPEPFHELCAAEHDPGLRAAEQLVAAEAHEVGALLERRPRRRLVAELQQCARPEVVEQRQIVPAGHVGQLGQRRALREADHPEVRLVDAEEQSGLGAERTLVVVRARPVGRPHLDESRARALEHLRDAKAVADLDQLAA